MTKIGIVIDPHIAERAMRARKDNFLETALGKLEYVLQNNDYIIIAGDLMHIHNNSTLFFNTLFTLFNKYKGKVHAIPGNHDVFSRNLSALNRTTLGSLYYTGALELHVKPWTLAGIEFVPVLVNTDPDLIPVDETNKKIMIAHKFYNQQFTPDESLFEQDIQRTNYNLCFLGHDHKPYPEEYIGTSTLIRMGSLTRIDTQCYNRDREIVYYQLNVEESGDYTYERKIVPYKPLQEVYTEEAYLKMTSEEQQKEVVSFVQIGDVLAKLNKNSEGSNSLDKTLRRLGTPADSIEDIRFRHQLNNVLYT